MFCGEKGPQRIFRQNQNCAPRDKKPSKSFFKRLLYVCLVCSGGGVLCTLHENVKVRLATMEKEEENRTEYSLGVFFSSSSSYFAKGLGVLLLQRALLNSIMLQLFFELRTNCHGRRLLAYRRMHKSPCVKNTQNISQQAFYQPPGWS